MFEVFHLAPDEPRRIVVQTHRGTDIRNAIAVDPVPSHAVAKFERISRAHRGWVHRKPPTGVYNCFGHVWASRRTAVYDDFDASVLRVRNDDGYRVVDWNRESPEVGDVACYWETVDPYRNCMHVGVVADVRSRGHGLPPEVRILSKWDDTSGEVVHEAGDTPLVLSHVLEYWTDRPTNRGQVIRP